MKIWDEAAHNAFTDLIRFHDRWLVVFREAPAHVSDNGVIAVLSAENGEQWGQVAQLTLPGKDLRDPKLSITPQGELMINAVAADRTRNPPLHISMVWTSADGRTWSAGHTVGEPNYWIWRIAWQDGVAYGVGYSTGGGIYQTRLYQSTDNGVNFAALKSPLLQDGYVNETALLFQPDQTLLTLTRRDPAGPNTTTSALLGTAVAPYTTWQWRDTGVRLGGPAVLRLSDGRIVVGARTYTPVPKMSLLWLDPQKATLTKFLEFPSGGDTGYPGLVELGGRLWVSYYSSHEGKTSIYLSTVVLR